MGGEFSRRDLWTIRSKSELETAESKFVRENIVVDSFELHGASVTMIGVDHVPETFDAAGSFWNEMLKDADVIVLEGAPTAEGFDKEKVARELTDEMQRAGLKPTQIEFFLKDLFKGIDFFGQTESVAHSLQKQIAIANPRKWDTVEKMDELDQQLLLAKKVVGYGGLAASAMLALSTASDVLRGTMVDRREALKLTGAASAITIGAAGMTSARFRGDVNQGDVDRRSRQKPLEQLLFQAQDYRDVTEGISAHVLAGQFKKIKYIYGKNHLKPIRTYVENQTETVAKLALYRVSYGFIEPPTLRIFSPVDTHYGTDDTKPAWELSQAINL